MGVRGCPKVRGANKRDEERKGNKGETYPTGGKGWTRKEKEKKGGRKKTKNKGRDKMGVDGGRMDEVEERPRIRMQIDVIAHDATAHESHTKLHRKTRMESNE